MKALSFLRQATRELLLIMIVLSSLLDNIFAMDEVDPYSKLTSKARMELAFVVMLLTNHTVDVSWLMLSSA